jgi:hypothetical protein
MDVHDHYKTIANPKISVRRLAYARMIVLMPVDSALTMDFHAKDVGQVSGIAPKHMENTGNHSSNIETQE